MLSPQCSRCQTCILAAAFCVVVIVTAKADPPSSPTVKHARLPRGEVTTDSPQWGGSPHRNNVVQGGNAPTDWDPGNFGRKPRLKEAASNIKWVAPLGTNCYGSPVVADGRVFIATNNGSAYLKRYPAAVDLGCLLCFRESDGKFLWQYSSEKLPSGRVNDWPLQGIVSTPLVEGNRMWFVDNRCQVVCLDTDGFTDAQDDGLILKPGTRLFEAVPEVTEPLKMSGAYGVTIRRVVRAAGVKLPRYIKVMELADHRWSIQARDLKKRTSYKRVRFEEIVQIGIQNGQIEVYQKQGEKDDGKFNELLSVGTSLTDGLNEGRISDMLRLQLGLEGRKLPKKVKVKAGKNRDVWTISFEENNKTSEFELRIEGKRFVCYKRFPISTNEADLVWNLDMIAEFGVFPHVMSSCSITSWKDNLFVCTSTGLDESHFNNPAPNAPSFIAVDKHTGRVLWTDNSPGRNILHGQWSSPAVGALGGVPQVIFCGGDGWVRSFRADRWSDGKPELLWKFDANPKESTWMLSGRGTRNNLVATPVIYDGLVYISAGQEPEHGDGGGHLWCIDPKKRGDVSPQLAVLSSDHTKIIPHRRLRAVDPQKGEVAIPNPNSAVVWHYDRFDRNGDGKFDFEERFHRSVSTVAVKDDMLFAADFSGLVHCLNAKSGKPYWVCDLFAACWGSPLIVNDRVYIGDEDGDIAILYVSRDPNQSIRPSQSTPRVEINMHSSIYTTPTFTNDVLYVANKSYLFAITANIE